MNNKEILNKLSNVEVEDNEYREKNTRWLEMFKSIIEGNSKEELLYIDKDGEPWFSLFCINGQVIPVPIVAEWFNVEYDEVTDIISDFIAQKIDYWDFTAPQNIKDEENFSVLYQEENTAKILLNVVKKVKDRNVNISEEMLDAIGKFLYKNFFLDEHKLNIEVIQDAKEFAEKATVISDAMEHSWAGSTKIKNTINVVYGEMKPAIKDSYCYYDNGNLTDNENESSEAIFNVNNDIIVFKEKHYFNNFNNNYENSYKYSLLLYLNGEYKISPELQKIIETFIR